MSNLLINQYHSEALYIHAFQLFSGFGPKTLLQLSTAFGSFSAAYNAPSSKLAKTWIKHILIERFLEHRQKLDLESERSKLESLGITLAHYKDGQSYPNLLNEITRPPLLLYIQGEVQPQARRVAVVGTRAMSNYGEAIIPHLLQPLIQNGIVVVSGLAYGVDATAHSIAIKAKQPTIAVVAGGLDDESFYPKAHLRLKREILSYGGALLSEHPPGTPPFKNHFIARNRIISGISEGTLVIECNEKSGALSTAAFALDQNRSVYAVPGSILSPTSKGTNHLIQRGALAVTQAEDILNDLHITPAPQQKYSNVDCSPDEQKILDLLNTGPASTDSLIQQSGLSPAQVNATLTMLELKNLIQNNTGTQYVRTHLLY